MQVELARASAPPMPRAGPSLTARIVSRAVLGWLRMQRVDKAIQQLNESSARMRGAAANTLARVASVVLENPVHSEPQQDWQAATIAMPRPRLPPHVVAPQWALGRYGGESPATEGGGFDVQAPSTPSADDTLGRSAAINDSVTIGRAAEDPTSASVSAVPVIPESLSYIRYRFW